MVTNGRLKSLFSTNIKFIAKTWLEKLHDIVEEKNESGVILSEQKLFWEFLSKHTLCIEYKILL